LHAVQSCIRNSDAEDDEGCCWQVEGFKGHELI
jgi:hypothetical protein